jgi:hypothetical protein
VSALKISFGMHFGKSPQHEAARWGHSFHPSTSIANITTFRRRSAFSCSSTIAPMLTGADRPTAPTKKATRCDPGGPSPNARPGGLTSRSPGARGSRCYERARSLCLAAAATTQQIRRARRDQGDRGMKVTQSVGPRWAYAIAVRDGAALFLFAIVRRARRGDVYVHYAHTNYGPDWDGHDSYHASGQRHHKSYGKAYMIAKRHQLPRHRTHSRNIDFFWCGSGYRRSLQNGGVQRRI